MTFDAFHSSTAPAPAPVIRPAVPAPAPQPPEPRGPHNGHGQHGLPISVACWRRLMTREGQRYTGHHRVPTERSDDDVA